MGSNRSIALVCVAVVLIALILPVVTIDVWIVMTPLWLVCSTAAATLVRRAAESSDEQPVALLSILASRAPPNKPLKTAA